MLSVLFILIALAVIGNKHHVCCVCLQTDLFNHSRKPEISYHLIKAPPVLPTTYTELNRCRNFNVLSYILKQRYVLRTLNLSRMAIGHISQEHLKCEPGSWQG